MKKKILFIDAEMCEGGSTRYLLSVLNVLDYDKYDVTLIVLRPCPDNLIYLVPKNVRVIEDTGSEHYYRKPKAALYSILAKITKDEKWTHKLNDYIHELKVLHPGKTYFKNEKFDKVVSNLQGFCEEVALKINGNTHISVYHSSMDPDHKFHEKIFPKFDTIITVSDTACNAMKRFYPQCADKMVSISNYIDARQILDKIGNDTEKNEKLTLCTCGRFTREKGFDLAVNAAAALKEKGYDFKWLFVGDGVQRCELEQMISDNGLCDYIEITGLTDNPFTYMKKCDIYVQPSYEESYGRTIKEAIIVGCPVVSTETVGAKFLLEGKIKGLLTPITAEGITDAVIKLISDEQLKNSLENQYSIEDNEVEKKEFAAKWNEILSI